MAEPSLFTRIVLESKEDIDGILDRARSEADDVVPFMMEQVSREKAAAYIKALPPDKLREYIAQNGVDKTVEILRGKPKATPKGPVAPEQMFQRGGS